MTRQAQNVILGGLAFAVGIVAIAAVFLLVIDDSSSTNAGAPLAPAASGGLPVESASVADGVSSVNPGTIGSSRPPLQPLAVPANPAAPAEQATTTTVLTTTTLATTTTTAASATTSATVAPATTGAPATTVVETTVAEPDTTAMPDSTDAPDTSAPADPEPEPSPTTETTAAPAPAPTDPPATEAPAPTDPPATGGLNEVEREIARMTNELRTNPNGPLRREGPVINCGGRVLVSNGQYDAIGSLQVNEVASLQVARPWSAQMTRSNFEHQARAGVPALQAAGIEVRLAGENIAYHSYSEKAKIHFEGWRESDGHFCNMMDPRFTHIGVGEVSKSDGISYATQNFYSTR